jgi:hypothetical protein
MLNEGILVTDTKIAMKSLMLRVLWRLGRTDPETWERHVFRELTEGTQSDVDWRFPDNQAGAFTWIKAFDGLITELEEDGYVRTEPAPGGGRRLVPIEAGTIPDCSHLVHGPLVRH